LESSHKGGGGLGNLHRLAIGGHPGGTLRPRHQLLAIVRIRLGALDVDIAALQALSQIVKDADLELPVVPMSRLMPFDAIRESKCQLVLSGFGALGARSGCPARPRSWPPRPRIAFG
jgi:hypothetical protein